MILIRRSALRTERAIALAMNVHPDKRIQSVIEFKEALLGIGIRGKTRMAPCLHQIFGS